MAAEDPRRAGLATLTGSFERTWYGGRAADESEYLKAEELAAGLISAAAASASQGNRRRCVMRFLSSLDAKDRKLLLWCVGIAVALAVATGFLLPNGNDNDNPLPSTYLAGQHGARAAYETLLRSGYSLERWERPLSELAATAGPETVVIFAQPLTREPEDIKAIRRIIERGGRVLSTGFRGGFILPGEASETPKEFNFAACQLEPEGLDALADSGEVWMVPEATWSAGNPAHRVEYSCAGNPAVVEYDWGKGHVVWWASSTPLENGSLSRAHNLDLLLNSLGAARRPPLLLGRVAAWRYSLHLELRGRAVVDDAVDWLAGVGCTDRLQLQPPQRAGARSAAAGARHAHRVS